MSFTNVRHKVLNPVYALFLGFILLFSSCSAVKFVADYDSTTLDKILDTGKKVDLFYGKLLEMPEKDRAYSKFADQYVEIEVDIRDLVTRNSVRPLNSESTKISETILKQWNENRDKHKAKDGYKDGTAQLDRDNLIDLFRYAANAESAKNLKKDSQ